MKTLHLVGHNHKWNFDSYFQNRIGSGFIFCAYSFEYGYFNRASINGHKVKDILNDSFLDLQYFGKRESGNIDKGKLSTYPFHPAALREEDGATNIYIENSIKEGIKYQIDLGLTNIIIPIHYDNEKLDQFIGLIKSINKWLVNNKEPEVKYFMSIPIANHTIIDSDKIEKLLYHLTDFDINFDGYYIVCESKPESMQKISIDIKYLRNLNRVFSVLKKQKFITIYAYANWDALVFLSLSDIDYISIATFENLRNFNIKRFIVKEGGGPSQGWYFSEKTLNFIKAQLIEMIRGNDGLSLIKNEKNIYSDAILQPNYLWNNLKPEVHKNFLISINKLLHDLASESDLKQRKRMLLEMINDAIETYKSLEQRKIYLTPESNNYHLDIWKSFLLSL